MLNSTFYNYLTYFLNPFLNNGMMFASFHSQAGASAGGKGGYLPPQIWMWNFFQMYIHELKVYVNFISYNIIYIYIYIYIYMNI